MTLPDKTCPEMKVFTAQGKTGIPTLCCERAVGNPLVNDLTAARARTFTEWVDSRGAPLWVLGEPPVADSLEPCDLSAGAGACATALLLGAGEVVLAGHDRQARPCGGSLEIAA
jgi:hypothetical protein